MRIEGRGGRPGTGTTRGRSPANVTGASVAAEKRRQWEEHELHRCAEYHRVHICQRGPRPRQVVSAARGQPQGDMIQATKPTVLVDGNNSMGSHRDGWLRNRTEAAPSMATASDRVSSGLTGWPVSAGWARYRGGIDIALLAIYGPESWVRIAHQSQRVRATGRARLTQAKSGICALFDSPPWVTAGAWKHPASCTSAKHQRPSLTTTVPASK